MGTWWKIFLTGMVLVLGVIGLVTVESPSLVLWKPIRAVVLESDDWGFAGFIPHAEVWQKERREELNPGVFPEVYWESILEDSTMVSNLAGVMLAHKGSDGLPAVFQPNYVMSSLSYEKEGNEWIWRRYDWPNLPPTYSRPGLIASVQRAVEAGVWYPEFHATWHYDPAKRLQYALSTEMAERLTRQGVVLFPHSEKARELGPWRSISDLQQEFSHSAMLFERAFERPVGSIIAPDYTWDSRLETMWDDFGLFVIQAKREQRNPTLLSGKPGRIQKFIFRKIDILTHRNRVYLPRNCRLEPVQAPDAEVVVQNCIVETHSAWSAGQPAVVETHRVNFAHADPQIVLTGLSSLSEYLSVICDGSQPLPVFMVDTEVAQLQTRGVSWVVRGDRLILRNGTHTRRLIVVNHLDQQRIFAIGAQSTKTCIW